MKRKPFHKIPSISVGGGEGFSIPIIKELYMDRDTSPPPPREANNEKNFPQSKLSGVEKFSAEPKPHPIYPQFRLHPMDVVASMRQEMKAHGLIGTPKLIKQYPLEIILEVINAVDEMIAEGVEVRNPAGLIKWRLEATGAELDLEARFTPAGEDTMSSRDDLTPAEMAMMRLIARGLSNKELCDELLISDHTLTSRISSILSKLGARNRAHAVAIALRRGIIDQEDVNGQGQG